MSLTPNEIDAGSILILVSSLQKMVAHYAESGFYAQKNNHAKVSAALNSIRDTARALFSFVRTRGAESSNADHYLRIYGYLQAIFVQQDALKALAETVKIEIDVRDHTLAWNVRDLRNDVAGHPTDRRRKAVKGYASIVSGSVNDDSFEYEISFENGVTERRLVHVQENVRNQLQYAQRWLQNYIVEFEKLTREQSLRLDSSEVL
jgi:hypothetical protein